MPTSSNNPSQIHDSTTPTHRIFSFGTLLAPHLQQRLFSRTVESQVDELPGHSFSEVHISDPDVVAASGSAVHRGLTRADGQSVSGGVISLHPWELARADEYEVAAYARRRVNTVHHGQVWAYVDALPLAVAQRIALIGDSIGYGRCDPQGGWAHTIASEHHMRDEEHNRFFNLCIPGVTLADLAGFAVHEAVTRRADTVIVAAGINDIIQTGTEPATLVRTTEEVCRRLEKAGIRPVIIGPLWNDEARTRTEFGARLSAEAVQEFNQVLQGWARQSYRDFVNLWPVLLGRSDLLADGLHPTSAGHAKLASAISGSAAEIR